MERNSANVKGTRRYDSSGRREQARRSRLAIVEAAQRMFLADGYAATTIAAIAAATGVSVETIYKSFGNKPALLRAIRDQALAGEGPVPAEHRSDRMQATESDPRRVIENWGKLTTEVAPRVAPILLLVRAASATDPELAALREEMDGDRLSRMAHNARYLSESGHLRHGVSFERARDVLFAYSSPELYELFVLRRGWSLEDYGRFLADAMIAALLPAESTGPAPAKRRSIKPNGDS